uniref:Uncharacterized protein n=1 Tax=Trypanosoma vivax (strain Y486) TaxID=1055687 RepID=G0UCQ1_TRYVY|nr:conserved hypothetical protein [Trypanosoma vivax Y486]
MGERSMSITRKTSMPKERGQSVVIPNIPKIMDERARVKLMCDYEKYEAEFFKHHIGTAETTCTMGVKFAPVDFDRHLPSRDEPTVAERAAEMRKQLRAKMKEQAARASTFHLLSVERSRTSGRLKQSEVGAHATGAGGGYRPHGGNSGISGAAALAVGTPASTAAPETLPGCHAQVAESAHPKASVGLSPVLAPIPIPEHVQLRGSSQRHITSMSSKEMNVPQPASSPATLVVGPKGCEPSSANASVPNDASVGASQRVALRPSTRKPNSLAWADDANAKSSPMRGKPVVSPIGSSRNHNERVAELIMQLHRNTQQEVERSAQTKPVRLQDTKFSYSSWDAQHCARLLRILLKPPNEFGESFKLDMRNIELRWMWSNRVPKCFVSLQTWRGGDGDDGVENECSVINSPRSVLVLLRNGVTVADLKSGEVFDDATLPIEPETRTTIRNLRRQHHAKKLDKLLAHLRSDYLSLCLTVSLSDILEEFHATKQKEAAAVPTSIREAQEKQKRVFEVATRQLEKHMAFSRDVQRRRLLVEERRRQAEDEARQKLQKKKDEERAAHEQALLRFKAQQQRLAEMVTLYQRQLEERLATAAAKNARLIEARERKMELRREEAKKHAEERKARCERMREMHEFQRDLIRQKNEEREARIEHLRVEQERKRREAHEVLVEKVMKSMSLRERARQRAAEHEDEVRQAAHEQQQKVEERIERFHQAREEERVRRAKKEAEKRCRMKEAFSAAKVKLETFKEEVVQKQEKHQKRYSELQQQREAEVLERRERDRQDMETKAFAVTQRQRITEFKKLEMVIQLVAKREVAEVLESQRELLLREAEKKRLALVEERNALKQNFARQLSHIE